MFIVSPPRHGTSLLYDGVAAHPDVGYLSPANKKLPGFPRLAHLLIRMGIAADKPRESRWFWDRFHTATSNVRTAADVLPTERAWMSKVIERTLAARGATRFVAKLPSFCVRVPWLDELFPDARYILIRRDWRAVVSSMLVKARRDGRKGWFGVEWPGRVRDADVPPALAAACSLVDLHGILDAERATREDRFVDLWYEDLCADAVARVRELYERCDLRAIPEPIPELRDRIRPVVDKWRDTLDPETIDAVRGELGEAIVALEHRAG
jgi:hypothetical protein